MRYQFTKMHGLGNDFVVFDAINQSINLSQEQIRFIADRHFGIGCDQVLLVEDYWGDEADFLYRIFNADGSEVEQCGNGARCFARFVRDNGLTNKIDISVMTATGKIILTVQDNGDITVNMGKPITQPEAIPFNTDTEQVHYQITNNNEMINLGVVSMGNPHAVLIVDDIDTAPVETLGAELAVHPAFPNRVNVGFMQILSTEHIRLRVFERGAGETLACGTGACAATVVGILQNKLNNRVKVDLPGGQLTVQWENNNTPVMMTGPAESVFTGSIEL